MQTGFWFRNFPRASFLYRRLARANYEPEMELLGALCDPDRTGLDVGAKVGMYTYRIRAHASDVIVFEPNPLWHQMLRTVFEGKRAHIEPVALSNTSGQTKLRMPYGHDGSREFGRSTIDPNNALTHKLIARVEEIDVEIRKLDDYQYPKIGFIKIDVEGHELAVLEGADATIRAQHPNLLIECNDEHHPGGVAKLADWLRAHDYEAWFMVGRELLPMDRYDRAEHWEQRSIENFICVSRSRPEVKQRLFELIKVIPLRPRSL